MNIQAPSNPLFAHSENIIYLTDVDQFVDCTFEIKTKGETISFDNRIMAYNGKCEVNLSEVSKMFYYRLKQALPIPTIQVLDGDNALNGGELKITLVDFSENTDVINYNVINGALQIGEGFTDEDQILNQVQLSFFGFPSDHTKYNSTTKKVSRIPFTTFPTLTKCTGIYVAWLNKYGAYDYYLFDGVPELDINASSLEEMQGYTLGKKSNRKVKIRAKINEDLKNYSIQKVDVQSTAKKITEAVMSIIESPEVYIFRQKRIDSYEGGAFDDQAFSDGFLISPSIEIIGDFIKVKEVTGNNTLNFKKQTTQIEFTITLPDERNITAI